MKQSKFRLSAVIALLLVFCMLLSSCSLFKKDDDDDLDDDQSDVDNGDGTTDGGDTGTGDGNPDDTTGGTTTQPCSHTETALVGKKDPTCAVKGYTGDTVCLACTAIVVKGSEINTIEHSYDDGAITKEPTCISTGIKTFTCSGCGTTKTEPVATVAHSDVYHNAEDGTHFHTCRTCKLNENQEHTPVDAGVSYPASCTEPAYVELTCSSCNGKYKVYDESHPALDHDWGDWEVSKEATCKAIGFKTQPCMRSDCNEKNKIELPKTTSCNMLFVGYDPAPTCNAGGVAHYECADCGKEETKDVAATGVHNYVMQQDKGDGWTHKVCSNCSDTISSYDASANTSAELTAGTIDKSQALEMDMEKATIQFPTDVVGQIVGEESANVSISADVADPEKTGAAIDQIEDDAVKDAVGSATVYDFTVKVGETVFSDDFSTKVTITLPYDKGDNDADGIVIYYLSEDGKIETITDVIYSEDENGQGYVTFFVEHFSFYAVAYVETQEMKCRRGVHNYVKTEESVTASCHSFGYTVWECSCCLRKTVDNIVERLPHNYGDLIEAKPTCSSGDYSHRICQNEGCGDKLLVQFKGATGHEIDAPATCTTPSTCTKCQNVVYRALGHSWTEWEIVVKPTEVTNGLRRRNCTTCGAFEEITLAATGNIDTITYDSYEELINLVFDKILKIKNGSLTFTVTAPTTDEYTLTVKAQKNEGGYTLLMSIPGVFTATSENVNGSVASVETAVDEILVYYRNGVFVADVPDDAIYSSSIDLVNTLPMDIYKAVLADLHAELNYYVESYVKTARLLFAEYSPIIAEDVDAMLAATGSDFTVAKIEDLIDSIETVYAYLSLKLGYATNAEIIEGITLPETKDFENIVSAFTTLTEAEDGTKTYTYDLTKLTDALNTATEWLEEKAEQTVAEFVYGLIGEKLLETNEELVDFDAFIDWLAVEVPGTLTVADGIDKLLNILEDKEIITIDSLYNLIDELAYKITGNNFNTKTYVANNGKATLNDFVGMMMGSPEATLDVLYDMIKENAAAIVVGDLGYQGITVSYAVEYAKGFLGSVQLVGGATFVFDKDGNFVSMDFNEDFKMATGTDEESGDTIYESFEKAVLNVVRDDEIVIELPEKFDTAIVDLKLTYDADGNLIIEGLDDSFELDFTISGSGRIDLDDVLKLDEKISAELGYNVYVIDEKFWVNGKEYSTYYRIDGKYYTAKYISDNKSAVSISMDLTALVNNPDAFKPEAGSEPDGRVFDSKVDEYVDAWDLGIGVVYQRGGEWMFAGYSNYYTNENGILTYNASTSEAISYDEFAANVRISNVRSGNYYFGGNYVEVDGKAYRVVTVNYYTSSNSMTSSKPCIVKDSKVLVVNSMTYNSLGGCYELTEISAIPDSDGYNVEEHYRYMTIIDENGERKEVKAYEYDYFVSTPVYFIKIADGIYAELGRYGISGKDYANLPSYVFDEIFTGAYDNTINLPDGNVMYVKGTDSKPDENGYTVVYGYAKTAEDFYIQTICRMNGESIVAVEYREANSYYLASYDETYNVKEYLTKLDGGKYKISKSLLEALKKYCTEPGRLCSISLEANRVVEGQAYSNLFTVYSYGVKPEINFGDMLGGGQAMENYWSRYFEEGEYNKYKATLNEDGSLTIYFDNGKTISNVYYTFGNRFPADPDKFVKDESGRWNGLDVYKLELSKDATFQNQFVYKDGKYYQYGTYANYDFELLLDPFARYYINNMSYRFDTLAIEGLEGGIPVYQTDIAFREQHYDITGGSSTITVYTFFIDGEMYVATGAKVTGESLLEFEGYVKLDDYVSSLKFELETEGEPYSRTCYYKGVSALIVRERYNVYETDAEGNKTGNSIGTVDQYYVTVDSVKNYIYDVIVANSVIIIGDEVSIPAGKYEDITYISEDYYNATVTMAYCIYTEKITATQYFVKLAGKYYRYSEFSCICNENYGHGCYWCSSISQYEFNESSRDKVWYYRVVDANGNILGHYTEFTVTEAGIVPQNETYEDIGVEINNSILLGYTPEGNAVYEISFWVDSAAGKTYTTETLSDGTVFYHVDGIGYLKDQAGRYIPARKMLAANGEYEIVCRIHSAYVTDGNLNYPGVLDAYAEFKVGGNYITISPELLEIAKANRSWFSLEIYVRNSGTIEINYDLLETLFLYGGTENMPNGDGEGENFGGGDGYYDKEEPLPEK